jgi:phage gp29-like protein
LAGDGGRRRDGLVRDLAWLFKNLPLKDWAIYCKRHGMPIIKGTTTAGRNTDEWTAMEEAVNAVASEYGGGPEQRRRD